MGASGLRLFGVYLVSEFRTSVPPGTVGLVQGGKVKYVEEIFPAVIAIVLSSWPTLTGTNGFQQRILRRAAEDIDTGRCNVTISNDDSERTYGKLE